MSLAWWRCCAAHGRVLSFGLLTDLLPWSARVDWLDDLGRNDQLLLNEEHAAIVAHCAAIICARCDRDQLVS